MYGFGGLEDVTIVGQKKQTNEQTREDRATQPLHYASISSIKDLKYLKM